MSQIRATCSQPALDLPYTLTHVCGMAHTSIFDTLRTAWNLHRVGIDAGHADAIRAAADTGRGDLATKGDIAALEARMIKWTIGIVLTVNAATAAAVIAAVGWMLSGVGG